MGRFRSSRKGACIRNKTGGYIIRLFLLLSILACFFSQVMNGVSPECQACSACNEKEKGLSKGKPQVRFINYKSRPKASRKQQQNHFRSGSRTPLIYSPDKKYFAYVELLMPDFINYKSTDEYLYIRAASSDPRKGNKSLVLLKGSSKFSGFQLIDWSSDSKNLLYSGFTERNTPVFKIYNVETNSTLTLNYESIPGVPSVSAPLKRSVKGSRELIGVRDPNQVIPARALGWSQNRIIIRVNLSKSGGKDSQYADYIWNPRYLSVKRQKGDLSNQVESNALVRFGDEGVNYLKSSG